MAPETTSRAPSARFRCFAGCPAKQVCRPSAIQTPFLRCVAQPAR